MLEHRSRQAIAAGHACLAGHFPGNPVVPAVVLLECVAGALSEALRRPARLTAVPAAKFLGPVLPEQAFVIDLQIDPQRATARFALQVDGQERAQGRIEYAHDA